MSSNSNTSGPMNGGCMKAFDKLPKALRVCLANADQNWSGEQLYYARKAKRHADKIGTIALAIAYIASQDKRKHDADAAAGLILGGQR